MASPKAKSKSFWGQPLLIEYRPSDNFVHGVINNISDRKFNDTHVERVLPLSEVRKKAINHIIKVTCLFAIGWCISSVYFN